ncbi:MAG: endolytic transglycosylase MltG [Gammaproteobacteria bacterium]|nr:endolytic transglycosylase MltG [Gammaproteobacteria bacterium]
MKRVLHKILGFLIILASLSVGWAMLEFKQFLQTPLQLPEEGVLFELKPGMSTRMLAAELNKRGYLENPLYLRLLARWEGMAQQLKAGEYRIKAGTKPRELLSLLISGKVTSYSLTLIEGWNIHQVIEAVHSSQDLRHTLLELSAGQLMERLGHGGEHPEGRFLPDTYHFPKGTTDVAFLQRAYESMARALNRKWSERDQDLPLSSAYEALILASIVEKETALASERPQIAGVFIHRLRKGMKLQTDPTVIYGIGPSFDGNIRRSDLRQDTPYNTYVHAGLPPTPIAMPGLDALDAVVHPAKTKNLYFVAKGDGSHHFSDTLAEHNRAVRKYQLKR